MTETPPKIRIEDYPAGTVIITRPADPEKLAKLHRETAEVKRRNPKFIPDHIRYNKKGMGKRLFKRVPKG